MSQRTPVPTPKGTTAPAATAAAVPYPGQKLGLVGLILGCVLGIVGAIISAVALVISLRNGHRNPGAVAGIIIGTIATLVLIAGTFYVIGILDGNVGYCAGKAPGSYDDGLMTYTCRGDG
jgi:hypothetical protein